MRKIWQGISFFKKSFQGWWVVASCHHPDSITWRWSISFDGRNTKLCWPKFGPSYSMGTKLFSPRGDIGFWICIPLVGTFGFNTQKHMWREANQ
jgi:hypothetical protein